MRNTFVDKITEMAENNPRIMIVTADLGYSVLERFENMYPDRFFNVGISEQAMTSVAAGLALEGNTVITYSIGNFPTLRCMEQIRNDICYHNANVKIVAVGGGFAYGQLGMSHHATEDIAMMRAIPGMKVIVPADPEEAAAAAQYAVENEGPCYIRLARNREPKLYEKNDFKIPKLQQLTAGGREVALVCCGPILKEILSAEEILRTEGIFADVYSAPCIKPLDVETLKKIAYSCRLVVTIEEHTTTGGLGGAVAEVFSNLSDRPATLYRLGLQDCFTSVVGDHDYLCEYYGISAGKIAESVRELLTDEDCNYRRK